MYKHTIFLAFIFTNLQALDSSPQNQQQIDSDSLSSDVEGSFLDDCSDIDSFSDNEVVSAHFNFVCSDLLWVHPYHHVILCNFSVVYQDGFFYFKKNIIMNI